MPPSLCPPSDFFSSGAETYYFEFHQRGLFRFIRGICTKQGRFRSFFKKVYIFGRRKSHKNKGSYSF